ALIDVFKGGEGGNIPLKLTVSNLRKLPDGGYCELWLTRGVKGKQQRIVSCGTFVAKDDRFVVALNAPYRLEEGTPGWIVTAHVRGAKTRPGVLTTRGAGLSLATNASYVTGMRSARKRSTASA